jgi:hypothetical protein
MFEPKRITCVEECTTNAWTIQSWNYETALDAKMAAAKVFTVKQGAMVKKTATHGWAVFFHNKPPVSRGYHHPFGPEYEQ